MVTCRTGVKSSNHDYTFRSFSDILQLPLAEKNPISINAHGFFGGRIFSGQTALNARSNEQH